MKYIRTKYGKILDMQNTSECIYVIRNKNIESKNCYVSWLWDNWKDYFLIDYQSCMLFSYNSAQIFISDLMKENLNYQDFVIELSPYYKNCKQADTIDELCDRAFAFHKESSWEIPDIEDFSLEILKEGIINEGRNTIDEFIFKLAIWTSKGLIYVAKAEGKGEPELI